MSNQNSTVEDIKERASSTYDSVANTVAPSSDNDGPYDPNKDKNNFAKDTHGNTFKKGDFKDQLNQAANGGPKQEPSNTGIVEKVLSHIPGISGFEKSGGNTESKEEVPKPGEPPKRPDHDVQVEQFLRKQYRSHAGEGMPDPDKKQ